MRGRSAWIIAAVLVAAIGGCGKDNAPSEPPGVEFTKVDLPVGGVPTMVATAKDALLIGTRRDGQPLIPGLLWRGPDGTVTDIPLEASSPYGKIARWFSIVSDGERIHAIGGENGGAHGNARWSVWVGQKKAVNETAQAFTTFMGYGSGELTDIVLTPTPVVVGTWQSPIGGYDLATWLFDGSDWIRQESAGTALASSLDELGFPVAATSLGQGIVVAGWALSTKHPSGPAAYVWRSSAGNTGWTKAVLPDTGNDGAAMSVRCWDSECAIAGRADGKLAAWRLSGDTWTRLPGAPPVPVTDKDHLAPPVQVDGKPTYIVPDGGKVKIARFDGSGWTVRTANGPTGTVLSTTRVGDAIYVVAGPDDANRTLWKVDVAALSR